MKKILIASTALVAFGVASAAQASSPIKLELGGSAQWMFGVATQHSDVRRNNDWSSTDVKGNNYLNVNGSTILDNGMKVGVSFLFRAGGNSHTDHNKDPLDRSFVYLEGRLGRLNIGTVDQAPKVLHVTAPDAAGLSEDAGNGIVSGRWVVAPNMYGNKFYYLDTTKINTADGAEKIVYYTPKMAGFTLGLGFMPGTASSGWADTGNRDNGTANETYTAALGFDDTFGQTRVRASLGWQFSNQLNALLNTGKGGFTGGTGGAVSARTHEYNDYNAGLAVSFDGWTVGGGIRYRDINKSRDGLTNWRSVDQLAWSVGVQYAFDPKVMPLTLSVNYYDVESKLKGQYGHMGVDPVTQQPVYVVDGDFNQKKKKDRLHNINVSAKYELGTGVNWLSSVGWIDFDSNDNAVTDNRGLVVMTGLGLAF